MEFFPQIMSVKRDIVNDKCILQMNTEFDDNLITGMEIPKEIYLSHNKETLCNVQKIDKNMQYP